MAWPRSRRHNHATHRIDEVLRLNPGAGETCDRGRRILVELPLVVLYKVETQNQRVSVLTVWRYEKRTHGA
jgi:hypothetical protein